MGDAPSPPLPRPGRCLLVRVDYGWPPPAPRRWRVTDLAWQALPDDLDSRASGLVLRGAESLLGWARCRGSGGLWRRLAARAKGPGLMLVCRFPRTARRLQRELSGAGAPPEFWETPSDAGEPPAYHRAGRESARLHAEFEWETACAAARGGVALLRTAILLAEGPLTAPQLAAGLGISAGAARSYLRWMDDVALLRWEGRAAALRHRHLEALFATARPETPPPPPPPRWDPVELD